MALLHRAKPVFVLPAEVYDAIHLASLSFGGIGHSRMYDDATQETPWCIHGMLEFAKGEADCCYQDELLAVGLTQHLFDELMITRGVPDTARVPFERVCSWLRIGRGTEVAF